MLDVIIKERLGLVEESYYTRHMCMRADTYGYFVRAVSTFRYRARALIAAFLPRFSSNSPRRGGSSLPIPRTRAPISRSLVARLLLVTGSHVHGVLCCTVSFLSRRRQRTLQFSPNHVGNSLTARLVSLISLIVPGASFVSGTIIGCIKSLYTR